MRKIIDGLPWVIAGLLVGALITVLLAVFASLLATSTAHAATARAAKVPLSMADAKAVATKAAQDELRKAPYPAFTVITGPRCERRNQRAVSCRYTLTEQRSTEAGAPDSPRQCVTVLEVTRPKGSRRPLTKTAVHGCDLTST